MPLSQWIDHWNFTYLNSAADKMFKERTRLSYRQNFKMNIGGHRKCAYFYKAYREVINTQKPVFINTFRATDTMVQVSLYPLPEELRFISKDITAKFVQNKHCNKTRKIQNTG